MPAGVAKGETAPMITVTADRIREQLTAIFRAWDMREEDIATTVRVMVETDLRGIDSHGIGMIPGYWERLQRGAIKARPDIRVVRETAAVAVIDADQSLGHPPSVMAMRMAVEKAREVGCAAVGVFNSNHYGAAGWYSMMAADMGVIGMAMTNAANASVVPTFGRDPMYATNPIGFAAPAERNRPFALDMATSTVAFGKINISRRADKKLPLGWALDETGAPETDSHKAFKARRLTPLGGTRELGSHKGYGLAMMVEILCATLTGAWAMGRDPATGERSPEKDGVGHFFLAIDPDKLRPEREFQQDLDRLMDMLRATPPADPAQPVLVAGDPEYAAWEERSRKGIPMTETLYEEVRTVAAESRAPFLLGN